jgi:DNA (cytosine-5)-methyltransferase 1
MGNQELGRNKNKKIGKSSFVQFCEFHDYDFTKYNGTQDKEKMARNLVDYVAGKTILDTALGIIESQNINQLQLEL